MGVSVLCLLQANNAGVNCYQMRKLISITASCLLLIHGTALARPQSPSTPTKHKSSIEKADTRVEPNTWGMVAGRVYDSDTGAPISDVKVSGYTDDGFLEQGHSTAKTNRLGAYRVQLILGRISHNFDLGRALYSTGIGILLGTATNTTKRLDVSRVALRAEANGYEPFEGVVIARSADAAKFGIDVQPILLARKGSGLQSVAATGWSAVRIESIDTQPRVAAKGQTVKIAVLVKVFSKEVGKDTEVVAYSPLWKDKRILHRDMSLDSDNRLTFSMEYRVSGREKYLANIVQFAISKSPVDYDIAKSWRTGLIQISHKDLDLQRATERQTALDEYRSGHFDGALTYFRKLAGESDPEPLDLRYFATLSDHQGLYAEAVDPLRKLVELDPTSVMATDDYVAGLYKANQYGEAKAFSENLLRGKNIRVAAKKLSSVGMGYYGHSLVKLGELFAAEKFNVGLLDVPNSGIAQSVIDFRGALRLAQVVEANAKQPDSPSAMADMGRALLDLGRFEEAISKLAEAAKADPNQVSIQKDLAWAVIQAHGHTGQKIELQAAVDGARLSVNPDGKHPSKDFKSWNQYGILLFALSEEQRTAKDPKSDETSDKAINALRQALSLGRLGAKTNPGFFDGYRYRYLSGSEVTNSGFAYPQANSSFVLLESLKRLRKSPLDKMANFGIATALYDLGQITLAEKFSDTLASIAPDFVEGQFLQALIYKGLGQDEKAQSALRHVLSIAPNHPRANLVLSSLLTEGGDIVSASECILQHARFYGEQEPR